MIFYCMKNTKDIYKLKVLFLLAIARYAQSTQNSKFPIALQYWNWFLCMQINIKQARTGRSN